MSFSLCAVIAEQALEKTRKNRKPTMHDPSAPIKIVYRAFVSEVFARLAQKHLKGQIRNPSRPSTKIGSGQCSCNARTDAGCSGCTPAEPYPPSRNANLSTKLELCHKNVIEQLN